MLIARGEKHIGRAELRWAVAFAPRLWSVVVERSGLLLDTRFVPAATESPRARSCLYLLLRGSWILHQSEGETLEAPSAFVVSDEQLEGSHGSRPFTFSARGKGYCAIEIHLRDEDLKRTASVSPEPFSLAPATWPLAEAAARLSSHDDETFQRTFAALLDDLAQRGLISRVVAERALKPPSKPHTLLWSAVRPMVERLYLNPTLQEVVDASGVSTRQVDRYIQSFVTSFGIVGDRWRATTRHFRVKLAVILLSADDASVADVAAAVGYGSPDAMARAFRDARLPPPAAVQQEVRAARGD